MKTYEITDARENTHEVVADRFFAESVLTFYKGDVIVGMFPNFIAMTLIDSDDE